MREREREREIKHANFTTIYSSIDAGIRHIMITGTSPKGLHPQILTSDSSSDRKHLIMMS